MSRTAAMPDHSQPRIARAFLLALALCLSTAPAHAQDTWAVIVATTRPTEMQTALDAAEHSAAALTASVGGVVPQDRAIARLESTLSEPFRAPPEDLARRLAQAAEATLEDVAFGRNQQALDVGQPLLASIDPHLAGLGRDEETAGDVANLCLYLVRAHVQKRDLGAAHQQIQVCLRLVPDLRADERLHPPAVRELLTETRASLERGGGGILAVHAAATDPDHCAIRVNGRRLGQTPWARIAVPPGPYVVQIECGDRASRLHRVQVAGDSPTRVTIHAELAQRLTTRPAVALVYSSRQELDSRLPDDVALVARALGVTRVLVACDDGRALGVRAFAVSDEGPLLVGSAPVPQPIDSARSREAVAAVLTGREPGAASSAPARTAPADAPPPVRSHGPDAGAIALGTILGIAGAAGLGVGWYFWHQVEDTQDRFARFTEADVPTARYVQTQDDLALYRALTIGAGAGGGALLVMSLPLLLPEVDGVPWWSFVFAAAGAGVVGVAVWQLLEPVNEIGPHGGVHTERGWVGGLILAHAAPLLSVPLVYAIREVTGDSHAGASVQLDEGRAMLRAWGTF